MDGFVDLLTEAAHLSIPHWGGVVSLQDEALGTVLQLMRWKIVMLRVCVHIIPPGLNPKLFFNCHSGDLRLRSRMWAKKSS